MKKSVYWKFGRQGCLPHFVISTACSMVEPLLGVILFAICAYAQLSQQERAIAGYVDSHNGEALQLLQKVVDIPSGSLNVNGVRAVGDSLRAEFTALGFSAYWIDGTKWKRAGHLVVRHPGKGPKILLIGHLDTVFECGSPCPKLDLKTGKGPGVIDMKGGDVIAIQALKALKNADASVFESMNITAFFTGDEESSGLTDEEEAMADVKAGFVPATRATLVQEATDAKFVIGLEDGDERELNRGITARRGSVNWKLTATATTQDRHSSHIFGERIGYGAGFEMARILDEFRRQLAGETLLTFSPGIVAAGDKVTFDSAKASISGKANIVASQAAVIGDLRTANREQFSKTVDTMKRIASQHLPGTDAKVEFQIGYPPLKNTPDNEALLARYSQASQDLGYGVVTASSAADAGAADVAWCPEGRGIIDGIGLKGQSDHSPEEAAKLDTLPIQTKRLAVLLSRLSR